MAASFAFNTLTQAGVALIAQATAANQIVFVASKSCSTAATDAADLASKDAAWYTGKTGTIAAVSATGTVCKIVAQYTNSGSSQTAKSFCVLARLASQSDSQAVVVVAKSDPDASIVLPGEDDVSQRIYIVFNIDISAAANVAVTPGACASIADLDRFVSMYKAGDPTAGETQTILGEKTFSDGIHVYHAATIQCSDASESSTMNSYMLKSVVNVANEGTAGIVEIGSCPDDDLSHMGAIKYKNRKITFSDSAHEFGDTSNYVKNIYLNKLIPGGSSASVGEDAAPYSVVSNSILPANGAGYSASSTVGSQSRPFASVWANQIHGALQQISVNNGSVSCEVGAITIIAFYWDSAFVSDEFYNPGTTFYLGYQGVDIISVAAMTSANGLMGGSPIDASGKRWVLLTGMSVASGNQWGFSLCMCAGDNS